MILERVGGGELYKCLRTERRLHERRAAQLLAQTTATSGHPYKMRITHGDANPENILLGVHSEVDMLDYACLVHAPSHHHITTWGTLDYLFPEMLASSAGDSFCNEKMDVWNLSMLMHKLSVDNALFGDVSATTKRRVAMSDHQMPDVVSTEGEDLTTRVTY